MVIRLCFSWFFVSRKDQKFISLLIIIPLAVGQILLFDRFGLRKVMPIMDFMPFPLKKDNFRDFLFCLLYQTASLSEKESTE